MTAKRLLKWIAAAVLAMAALVAIGIGGLWLFVTEPWYTDDLIDRMGTGGAANAGEIVSDRIAVFFPRGLPRTKASALLWRNGFSCSAQSAREGETMRLACNRTKSHFVCTTYYQILLSLAGGAVVTAEGSAHTACL